MEPGKYGPYDLSTKSHSEDPLFIIGPRKVTSNLPAIARAFAEEAAIAFCEKRRAFFHFDEAAGIWVPVSIGMLRNLAADFMRRESLKRERTEILTMRTPAFLSQILKLVEGCAPFGNSPEKPLLPVANGVLDLSGDTPVLLGHSREYWFDRRIEIEFATDAQCPRFLTELVQPALSDPDDVALLQRDLGRQLFDGNTAQRISLLHGEGGSGKSVLISVFEGVVGRGRIAHLRADRLADRFEADFFQSKAILLGKDVRPDFLNNRGATVLKSLTGKDLIETERKYGGKSEMVGNRFVLITANSRLLLKIENDRAAWSRRLIVYNFSRKQPAVPIAHFDEILLKTEGAGILNWFIEGYYKHRRELHEHGAMKLTPAQQKRVDNMILESEAEAAFVEEALMQGPGNITSDELWEAYRATCRARGWKTPSMQRFLTRLPEHLMDRFGVERSTHILRNGVARRGFSGVVFKPTASSKAA